VSISTTERSGKAEGRNPVTTQLIRTLLATILLVALAVSAQAQKTFIPESLAPLADNDSAVPRLEGRSLLFDTPAEEEEVWALDSVSGLKLRQSVKVNRVDLFGQRAEDTPFFYLFRQQESTDIMATLRPGTRFTYTRQLTSDLDALDRRKSYNQYSDYALEQDFGGGASAMTLGFRRGVREIQTAGAEEATRINEESYSLSGGLGDLGKISLGFAQSQAEGENGRFTKDLSARLVRSFSGGEGKFSFLRSEVGQGNALQTDYTADVFLPLAVRGGTAQFAYQRKAQVKSSVETSSRSTLFSTPLAFWGSGASFTWQLTDNVKPGQDVEQRTTTAVLPLRLFDRTVANTIVDERVTANGAETRRQSVVWGVPFEKTQITLGYTSIQPYSATGVPGLRQRIQTVQMPMLPIFTDRLRAGFAQTTIETIGGTTVRTTKIDADAHPIERLTIAGQFQEQDSGPDQTTQTTQVRSDLAVANNLNLNWRYLERQQVGLGSQVERYVGVERKVEAAVPLQMRIGYTTYETPDNQEPRESAYGAQLAFGKPEKTTVTATYMQFEEQNLGRLPEDSVQLALTHRLSADVALRAEYEDQPGRVEPMRGLLLQTPALGGSVTLSHRSNPQDPRNDKVVRQADQWDAELKRQLGSLDLMLSYRYCEYERQEDQVEQYLKLAIAGGKPERGGQLTLGYLTGDFVPPSPRPGDPLPGSALELKYQKNWSTAQVSLSLRRTTAPWGDVTGEDNAEARLELKALW